MKLNILFFIVFAIVILTLRFYFCKKSRKAPLSLTKPEGSKYRKKIIIHHEKFSGYIYYFEELNLP